jgi:hypothetical protein
VRLWLTGPISSESRLARFETVSSGDERSYAMAIEEPKTIETRSACSSVAKLIDAAIELLKAND